MRCDWERWKNIFINIESVWMRQVCYSGLKHFKIDVRHRIISMMMTNTCWFWARHANSEFRIYDVSRDDDDYEDQGNRKKVLMLRAEFLLKYSHFSWNIYNLFHARHFEISLLRLFHNSKGNRRPNCLIHSKLFCMWNKILRKFEFVPTQLKRFRKIQCYFFLTWRKMSEFRTKT